MYIINDVIMLESELELTYTSSNGLSSRSYRYQRTIVYLIGRLYGGGKNDWEYLVFYKVDYLIDMRISG